MLRLVAVALMSLVMVSCGSPTPPPTEAAGQSVSVGEPAAPSAAVARFTASDAGAPAVESVRLSVREAGTVALPDGRLAVSDAFVNDYPLVLTGLPAGEYVVELLVADAESDGRIAAARVRITGEPAATWRRAGYFAVDSGNGAFFDPRISATIGSSNVERFNDDLLKALEHTYRNTYSIASLSWEGMTFVAFSTGWGDGRYPVYVGTSAAGSPVTIVVDCEILPWSE